jgi:hypothetical protein
MHGCVWSSLSSISRSAALRALQEHTPRPDFGSDRPIGEARWRITKE